MADVVDISVRLVEVGDRAARVQPMEGEPVTVSLATADIEPDPHVPGWHLLTMPRELAAEAGLV